jgi:hypothetical protein
MGRKPCILSGRTLSGAAARPMMTASRSHLSSAAMPHDPEGPRPTRTPATPAGARHLPAAEPADHGLPVLRVLRHCRGDRRQLRARRAWGGVRRDAVRRPRWPGGAPDGHRERLRQGIRQPRRHGLLRLAPAIVAYQWGVERIAEYGTAWGRFGWLAAFFYAVCAALRLARFNTRTAAQTSAFSKDCPAPRRRRSWRPSSGLERMARAGAGRADHRLPGHG